MYLVNAPAIFNGSTKSPFSQICWHFRARRQTIFIWRCLLNSISLEGLTKNGFAFSPFFSQINTGVAGWTPKLGGHKHTRLIELTIIVRKLSVDICFTFWFFWKASLRHELCPRNVWQQGRFVTQNVERRGCLDRVSCVMLKSRQ